MPGTWATPTWKTGSCITSMKPASAPSAGTPWKGWHRRAQPGHAYRAACGGQERRVVPETIARFLAEAAGHAGAGPQAGRRRCRTPSTRDARRPYSATTNARPTGDCLRYRPSIRGLSMQRETAEEPPGMGHARPSAVRGRPPSCLPACARGFQDAEPVSIAWDTTRPHGSTSTAGGSWTVWATSSTNGSLPWRCPQAANPASASPRYWAIFSPPLLGVKGGRGAGQSLPAFRERGRG